MESDGLLKSFMKNSSMGAKVAVILFFVLVVVVIVLAILLNVGKTENTQDSIEVSNFDELVDVPKEYKVGTEQLIWQLISQNEPIPDFEKYEAKVRDGSYSEEATDSGVNANFIIDIEELRYSFEVNVSWIRGLREYSDPYIAIRCPYYTDVIYPDTKCVAELPTAQIRRYLPHNHYLADGHRVHIAESNFGKMFKLLVYVEACKDQSIVDAAMNSTRDWIKSIYLDPDDYKMESYDACY